MAQNDLNQSGWLRRAWRKRWVKCLLFTGVIFIGLFIFRTPILRSIGNYLVANDPLVKNDAYFVLGGNSYERGLEAVNVYHQHPDAFFVTTGANYPMQVRALDTLITEASLTRHLMIKKGVPASQIDTLSTSTSTFEDADVILAYCKARGLDDITVISSTFHLRRMRMVFEDRYRAEGITVRFHGAIDHEFNQYNWWQDELGLITTNNEYIKILYYAIKY